MSIYIKVNNTEYPATVKGERTDRSWDNRDTKTIYLTMTHDEAVSTRTTIRTAKAPTESHTASHTTRMQSSKHLPQQTLISQYVLSAEMRLPCHG